MKESKELVLPCGRDHMKTKLTEMFFWAMLRNVRLCLNSASKMGNGC